MKNHRKIIEKHWEQWHTAAQPIAVPYSLTETRFCEGDAETFGSSTAGHAPLSENAEMANYAEFHAMKLALRDNDGDAVGANNYSPLHGMTATMNLRHVPAGVYLLRVTDADGKEHHRKIVRK